MCGLAGMARHPKGADFEEGIAIVERLIAGIEHRGRHATGVATVGGSNPFVWKWAAAPLDVLKSDEWRKTMDSITPNTRIVLGHVRHATLNNKDLNEAAHPFKFGAVVGAHNGMIHNWQALAASTPGGDKWIVDSEAAFALLNMEKNPINALNALNGWWALTWAKGKALFVTRTSEVPFAMAYVEKMKALFWASERSVLERVLNAYKLDYKVWEIKPNVVYQYNTDLFSKDGTGVVREDVAFTSKTMDKPVPRDNRWSRWERSDNHRVMQAAEGRSKQLTLTALYRRIEKLEDMVESLVADNEFMFSVVQDAGLLDTDWRERTAIQTDGRQLVLPIQHEESFPDPDEAFTT